MKHALWYTTSRDNKTRESRGMEGTKEAVAQQWDSSGSTHKMKLMLADDITYRTFI